MPAPPSPHEAARLQAELEAAAVRELLAAWNGINRDAFRGSMRAPTLMLLDGDSRLGFFDPRLHRLALSRRLVFEATWGQTLEVLKHEMAHQFVFEVLRVHDETAHGRAFQEVCARLGVDPAASGLPETQPRSDEEERVLARIARLLALADSPNEHEAQAAMNAAQKLMLKYNLSAASAPKNYCFRQLGEPTGRTREAERWLATILNEFFFVETIWVPAYRPNEAKKGTVLEVCGSQANVEMAAYVHAFLLETAERLWKAHKKATGERADRDRQKYLSGVMLGFREKLAEQSRQHASEGLVWVQDGNLDDYFRHRHPRVRTVRYQGAGPSEAHEQGRLAGRNIVLHRPVTSGPQGGPRLLGTGKG